MTVAVLVTIGIGGIRIASSHGASAASSTQLTKLSQSASDSLSHTASIEFSMTTTISAQGHERTLLASGVSSDRNHESSLTTSGGGIKERGLNVGGVAYFKMPGDVALNDGKRWIAVRTPKPTAQVRQLAASGPSGLLSVLNNGGGPVEDEGMQTIGSVPTTKYSFHMDGLKLFGSLFKQIYGPGWTAKLKAAGFDNTPVSIWLDRTGFAREIEMSLAISGVSIHEAEFITPSNTVLHLIAPSRSQVHMVRTLRQYGEVVQLAAIAEANR